MMRHSYRERDYALGQVMMDTPSVARNMPSTETRSSGKRHLARATGTNCV